MPPSQGPPPTFGLLIFKIFLFPENHGYPTDIHGYPCTIIVVLRGDPYFMDIREHSYIYRWIPTDTHRYAQNN
jgi:hypothetical protein